MRQQHSRSQHENDSGFSLASCRHRCVFVCCFSSRTDRSCLHGCTWVLDAILLSVWTSSNALCKFKSILIASCAVVSSWVWNAQIRDCQVIIAISCVQGEARIALEFVLKDATFVIFIVGREEPWFLPQSLLIPVKHRCITCIGALQGHAFT